VSRAKCNTKRCEATNFASPIV